jgi:uncharacterized protein YndB with AHSA1/START domain
MSDVKVNNDAYGTVLESGAVRFERLLPGPVERVWSYITDPAKRVTWLAAGEMELRVGGRVMLEFDNSRLSPQGEAVPERYQKHNCAVTNPGRITDLNAPHLLAMTWGDKGDGSPASEVVFELKPQGKKVLLTLTHRRLTSSMEGLLVSCGWHVHLGVLVARLQDDAPPPFWARFDALEVHYKKHFMI